MLVQFFIIGLANEHRVVIEKMDFLLVAHADVGMSAQKVVQRRRAGFLRTGGSGSFVSENGLVITNHHVGADTLQKMGDAQHNYLRDGFYAKTQADEIKSTDLELNVLISIEDVTARVTAAVKAGTTSDQASNARNAAIAAIEKESKDKTGLRSDVVTLYQGGAY